MIELKQLQTLKSCLFSGPPATVFAILDGASIPDLPANLASFAPEHVCLYRGELGADMAEVAPYLAILEPSSAFTDWVLTNAWDHHWGILGGGVGDLASFRKHFRTLLIVYDESGESIYFRYYDPRVLRVYLPTCTADELKRVFGPVQWYLVEDDRTTCASRFSHTKSNLLHSKIDVHALGSADMLKIRPERLERYNQLAHKDDSFLIDSVPTPMISVQQGHRVRHEQVEAMADAQFISRVIQMLKEVFPQSPPDDAPDFARTLQKLIVNAKSYAIVEDMELARYICLAYLFGDDFDTRNSAAHSLLMDRSRPADERLSLLEFWAERMVEASSVEL